MHRYIPQAPPGPPSLIHLPGRGWIEVRAEDVVGTEFEHEANDDRLLLLEEGGRWNRYAYPTEKIITIRARAVEFHIRRPKLRDALKWWWEMRKELKDGPRIG